MYDFWEYYARVFYINALRHACTMMCARSNNKRCTSEIILEKARYRTDSRRKQSADWIVTTQKTSDNRVLEVNKTRRDAYKHTHITPIGNGSLNARNCFLGAIKFAFYARHCLISALFSASVFFALLALIAQLLIARAYSRYACVSVCSLTFIVKIIYNQRDPLAVIY